MKTKRGGCSENTYWLIGGATVVIISGAFIVQQIFSNYFMNIEGINGNVVSHEHTGQPTRKRRSVS